ncbi:3-hydroxyacyl-CoA dehydrogenase [Ramlibacter sp. MAHUQ-53]|uniref:3-hydroxyacyl-CoA dehydrogenase n=1 Tax=unclassified Ramlibacter TaxID=2617605 RepID=UPI003643B5CD
MHIQLNTVGVVGAGAMGRGIAQLIAQAGLEVRLCDADLATVASAQQLLAEQWARMAVKGQITAEQAQAFADRVRPSELASLADCGLVIEAIVERMEAKQQLFSQLEAVVGPDTVLASNTSSLSITALAAGLQRPGRVAGLHFFNPVPLMKLVEVVGGERTDAGICEALVAWVRTLGHQPVRAQDTPGFIVNHAGRAFSTEALRIVAEGVADYATVDRILRDQAGFRLGPFELMDLTGLDVSHPVMESIYRQYHEEPRLRPGDTTARRVAAGLLGRKTGQGFYTYADGKPQVPPEQPVPAVAEIPPVWVSTRAARRAELYQLLKDLGARIETGQSPSPQALTLVAPLGFDVTTVAVVERLDPARTVGIDFLIEDAATRRRVLATNPATRPDMRDAAHALFARDGKAVSVIRDSGGFVTQRVLACIVNLASDICQQRICSPADLETAVTLGLGYPQGPLAMGNRWGPASMLEVLFNMQTVYGDPRYRPSPWLRRRGAIGLSLLQEEN